MTQEGIGYSGRDALIVPFQRRDANGDVMFDDPMWVLRFETPSALVAGTEYPVDGSQSDVLRLGDAYRWQSSACPDLTGSVFIDDIAVDAEGLATEVVATFELHCRPQDAVYGAVGVGASAPSLAVDALPVMDREARFPSFVSNYADGHAETVAIDVHRRHVLLRWDTPSGFDCASASVTANDTSQPLVTYSGRDDTLGIHHLNPTEPHTVNVVLGSGRASTCSPDFSSSSSTVLPLRTRLIDVTPKPDRSLSIRGRVMAVVPGYSEPARFVETAIKGRRQDGSVAVLATSRTDIDGYFTLSTSRTHSRRVWAVVKPGNEPAAPESPRQYWYHFGDRSPGVRVAGL